MLLLQGWFCGKTLDHVPLLSELDASVVDDLKLNIAMNSKAFLIEHASKPIEFVGNRTECALLMLLKGWGIDYRTVREQHESSLFKVRASSKKTQKQVNHTWCRDLGLLRMYVYDARP